MNWRGRAPAPPPEGTLALGSGEAERRGVAAKAAQLDAAAARGLPVPDGFIVPDGLSGSIDARSWSRSNGVDELAVRSAFSAEDRDHSSLAGYFTTRLRVRVEDLDEAVGDVRRSAERHPGRFRTDVLVMAMVDAAVAGVAFTEPETYDDLVNVVGGTAEHLVGGRVAGTHIDLPRLERVPGGWRRRLQALLRQVRRVFGDRPWDIEWADDGSTCWLVQLRPITAPPLRNEALTLANHAEILPPLPSTLMTSVIADAGPELFAWYRRRDPTLPANRDFLHVVAGRPFINLSLLEDMMRHLGLPTTLVTESIGGTTRTAHPARPLRMARKWRALMALAWAQVWAVATARSNERRVASHGHGPVTDFDAALTGLHAAYVDLVTGMFPLSSAIGPPMAVLRRLGTLHEHAARHRTITVEMADAMAAATSAHDRSDFLERFGHRGVYESDIARPRYADRPDLVSASTRSPARPPRRTLRGLVTLPIWWLTSKPLAARERYRHEAMRSFGDIRRALARLADDAVTRGQLRSVDDLWKLRSSEARSLDDGWQPPEGFWEERDAEIDGLAALDPPPLVHRFDDPADWRADVDDEAILRGLPLTSGTVRGRAWVLRHPGAQLPDGYEPGRTILVAKSVDAGWISTVSQAAGVVVEIGGDLSHGSILLREQGVPAITNVRSATSLIDDGDELELRAASGVVERVARR